jgi:hypothetical protein
MQISEKALDYLESHIPELALAATKQAYWQALASGSSVLISQGTYIIEVFPDGTTQIIEKTMPFVKTPINKIIELR